MHNIRNIAVEEKPKMVCFGQYASYQFNCKFCDFLQECREATIARAKGKKSNKEKFTIAEKQRKVY